MEQLGLLEVLLEPLSAHLRDSIQAREELEQAPAVRHLAALGDTIAVQGEQARPLVLACMFADLYLARARENDPERRVEVIRNLQSRGFARGDCEQMRLLLDALVHMTTLTRHLRRIARRPYYSDARRLLEFVAPVNGVGVAELDRFMAELNENGGLRRRINFADGQNGNGRKRKRRRGGRRHRRRMEAMASISGSVAGNSRLEARDVAPAVTEQAEASIASESECAQARER
jgi:hypothetical protein